MKQAVVEANTQSKVQKAQTKVEKVEKKSWMESAVDSVIDMAKTIFAPKWKYETANSPIWFSLRILLTNFNVNYGVFARGLVLIH